VCVDGEAMTLAEKGDDFGRQWRRVVQSYQRYRLGRSLVHIGGMPLAYVARFGGFDLAGVRPEARWARGGLGPDVLHGVLAVLDDCLRERSDAAR
jgi:hypothetical protein